MIPGADAGGRTLDALLLGVGLLVGNLAAGIGPWVSGVLYGQHGDNKVALVLAALAFASWLLPRSRVEAPASARA